MWPANSWSRGRGTSNPADRADAVASAADDAGGHAAIPFIRRRVRAPYFPVDEPASTIEASIHREINYRRDANNAEFK